MLGKTAAEREAEDTTRESDGGKLAAMGLGALFTDPAHGHGHGHGPCDGHGHSHGVRSNLEMANRAMVNTIFDAAYTGEFFRLKELIEAEERAQIKKLQKAAPEGEIVSPHLFRTANGTATGDVAPEWLLVSKLCTH